MKYHFKVGRDKQIVLDASQTFEDLCWAILKAYRIDPDHIFLIEFPNGEETDSGTPLGPMSGTGNIPLQTPLSDQDLKTGDVMTFYYNPSYEWSRKIRLMDITFEKSPAKLKGKRR